MTETIRSAPPRTPIRLGSHSYIRYPASNLFRASCSDGHGGTINDKGGTTRSADRILGRRTEGLTQSKWEPACGVWSDVDARGNSSGINHIQCLPPTLTRRCQLRIACECHTSSHCHMASMPPFPSTSNKRTQASVSRRAFGVITDRKGHLGSRRPHRPLPAYGCEADGEFHRCWNRGDVSEI